MGWWSTGNGDDVTGDEPADIVTTTLHRIAESRRKRRRRKPSLPELLNAMAGPLGREPESYLTHRKRFKIKRLIATARGRTLRVEYTSDLEAGGRPGELEPPIREALTAIATAYEQAVDRKPRLSEVLSSFEFVLGDEPEEYLSGLAGVSVDSIVAE